ncbi:MAG: hypothetical protein ACK56I_13580, partial [bacterium]
SDPDPIQLPFFRIRYTYRSRVCRTDAGVHAYCNTATVDLAATPERGYCAPKAITASLNTFFLRNHLDVR